MQQQAFEVNSTSFLIFRFSLAELNKKCPLTLRLACGPGVIEIERVMLRSISGPQHEFRGSDLIELLTVAKNGIAAKTGAVQRFFSSIPPVDLNVWGETHQAAEMEIHLRFLNRHQAMALAVGNLGGIHWIDKQLRKKERAPALIETPVNTGVPPKFDPPAMRELVGLWGE